MSDEQLRQDELVSAYLDGEATPAEIAEVEQDDALMARVEQLRSVRNAAAAPVAPVSDELRDRMISTALAAADAETVREREARTVPIHRRRETLLAVAAAAVLLAAVVSAGLIASRGGDESAEMAAAPTESADAGTAADDTAAAPAEAAPAAEEEPMADEEPMAEEAAVAATTTEAYVEMPQEEPMAELEAAMGTADVADEAAAAEAEAAMAAAEAESALEAPAEEAADAPTASTEEGRRTAEEAAGPVVNLGAFENLESLFDDVAARWSAALEDGATADSGTCSAAVHDKLLELDVETGQPFVATVGAEDPLTVDARFARRADGTALIIYAAPPNCETGTYEQDEPDDP